MKAASFGCRKPLSNGVKNRIVAEPEMEHACNTLQKTDHNQSLSGCEQIGNLLSWARSSPEIPLFGGKIGACAELRRLIVKPLARADPGSRALGFGAFGRSADPLASGP